jgi:hypothetical protein
MYTVGGGTSRAAGTANLPEFAVISLSPDARRLAVGAPGAVMSVRELP